MSEEEREDERETKDELGAELADEDRKAGSPDLSGTPERENFKELYGTDGLSGSAGQSEPSTGSAPATPPTT
jgi:hypothetical protein